MYNSLIQCLLWYNIRITILLWSGSSAVMIGFTSVIVGSLLKSEDTIELWFVVVAYVQDEEQ